MTTSLDGFKSCRRHDTSIVLPAAGLIARGTTDEEVKLTLALECLAVSTALQPAVDDAAPVALLECRLLVEPSTTPASLQLLLDGLLIRQACHLFRCTRVVPRCALASGARESPYVSP